MKRISSMPLAIGLMLALMICIGIAVGSSNTKNESDVMKAPIEMQKNLTIGSPAGEAKVVPMTSAITDKKFGNKTALGNKTAIFKATIPPTSGTSDILVTLVWNEHVDLDLHVIDPNNEEIDYLNPTSSSGGILDRDNKCYNWIQGESEDISWAAGTAPKGHYIIKVVYYEDCTSDHTDPIPFTVQLYVNGKESDFPMTISPPASGSNSVTVYTFDYVIGPEPNAKGVDASDNNNPITDWSAVYGAGYRFAYIKATQGKYFVTGGSSYNLDTNYVNNAIASNLKIGVYHYADPQTDPGDSGASDEANYFVRQAGNYIKPGYLPPALDLEWNDVNNHGSSSLNGAAGVDWIKTWMDTVKTLTGVKPIIYTSSSFITGQQLTALASEGYDLWVSDPNPSPPAPRYAPWTTWRIWQNSVAQVPGIHGNTNLVTDLDLFYGNELELSEYVVPTSATIPIFRMYSPSNKDHFYTTSYNEYSTIAVNFGYTQEGILGYIYSSPLAGTIPIYRMWSPSNKDHFYTTSYNEYSTTAVNYGYKQEGILGYAQAGTIPMYRMWSPGDTDHFYTTNYNEYTTTAVNYGYKQEGILGYCAASPIEN